MSLHQDRAYLDAFRRGQPAALARVYREFYRSVYSVFRHGFVVRGSDAARVRVHGFAQAADIEDLVQETFRRTFGEATRQAYDGLRPFEPWLMTIARRVAVDALRKGGSALPTELELGDESVELVDPGANPEQVVQAQQVADYLSAFFEGLSERDQGVFDARFRRAQTRAQTSAETGLSAMQVRYIEARLRRRAIKLLRDRGYVDADVANQLISSFPWLAMSEVLAQWMEML